MSVRVIYRPRSTPKTCQHPGAPAGEPGIVVWCRDCATYLRCRTSEVPAPEQLTCWEPCLFQVYWTLYRWVHSF